MKLVYYYARSMGSATATRVCTLRIMTRTSPRYTWEPSAYIIIITITIRIEHHGMYVVIMGRVKKKKRTTGWLAGWHRTRPVVPRYSDSHGPSRVHGKVRRKTRRVLLWQNFIFLHFPFFSPTSTFLYVSGLNRFFTKTGAGGETINSIDPCVYTF